MIFIFQAKPSIYNLSENLEEGREVGWLASRYKDLFKKGDVVYYWSAGDEKRRGIYGWGEITSDGAFIDSRGIYRVAVTCRKVFPSHLKLSKIRTKDGLENLSILRSPMGTNFTLTSEEAENLDKLVAKNFGDSWAPSKKGGV